MKYLILLLALIAMPLMAQDRQVEDWRVNIEQDPFSDSQNVLSYTQAKEEAGVLLAVRCFGNSKAVVVSNGRYIGNDSSTLTYRFDDREAQTGTFSISSNGMASIIYNQDFYSHLINSNTLLVRMYNYRGSNIGTYTFSLLGSSDAAGLVNCDSGI